MSIEEIMSKIAADFYKHPVKSFDPSQYSDDEIREILRRMRERIQNPGPNDEYGTKEPDYWDWYKKVEDEADRRGIIV